MAPIADFYATVAAFTYPDIGYEIRLERLAGAPYFRIKVYGGDPEAPAPWEFEGVIGRMSEREAISRFLQTLSEHDDNVTDDVESAQHRAEVRGAA